MNYLRVLSAGSLLSGLVFIAGCNPATEAEPPAPTAGVPAAPSGPIAGSAETGTTAAGTEAVSGEAVYKQFCQGCHGETGTAGTAKVDLVKEAAEHEPSELREVVLNGEGKMPSFKGRLSDEQIDAVIAYVRGLRCGASE